MINLVLGDGEISVALRMNICRFPGDSLTLKNPNSSISVSFCQSSLKLKQISFLSHEMNLLPLYNNNYNLKKSILAHRLKDSNFC